MDDDLKAKIAHCALNRSRELDLLQAVTEICTERDHLRYLLNEQSNHHGEQVNMWVLRVKRLREVLEMLLSYTLACEGLLNATESEQCKIARALLQEAGDD